MKIKFPYINTFDQEGSVVIRAMRNIMARVFEHLEITSGMDVDKVLIKQSAPLEEHH